MLQRDTCVVLGSRVHRYRYGTCTIKNKNIFIFYNSTYKTIQLTVEKLPKLLCHHYSDTYFWTFQISMVLLASLLYQARKIIR
jgi:hypothetical protein